MFEMLPSDTDNGKGGIPFVSNFQEPREKLSYVRQGLYSIRPVGSGRELRQVGGEYLLRVNGGSPEEYLKRVGSDKKQSLRLAIDVVSHANNLIGDSNVPGTSFVNLHVSDISLKFVRFLEDHRVDPSIAFEIVENTVLTPTSIKALQSMVRAGYNRIVVDDFPVYTTVGNHGEANLQKLDKAGIVPFAIKLNGKCVREVMGSLDYKKIEQLSMTLRARFGEEVKMIAEWVVPGDMEPLSAIDPKILIQGRDLDIFFGSDNTKV